MQPPYPTLPGELDVIAVDPWIQKIANRKVDDLALSRTYIHRLVDREAQSSDRCRKPSCARKELEKCRRF